MSEQNDCRRLVDKVAMVAGASRGLGESICYRLAKEGAHVSACDPHVEAVKRVAATCAEKYGVRAIGLKCDVTVEKEVEAAVRETVEQLGGLDILIANAGIVVPGAITEIEVEDWRRCIEVNLIGYMICCKHAARVMLERGGGVIVQINSKSGKRGSAKNSAYAASKFGGIGLTQSLALEFATQNIRVNAVCPGNLLEGPLWKEQLFPQYAQRWGISIEEVRQRYIDQVPMKRSCTDDDVCNAVVFLCSDESSYITGQALNVDGGQTMH
jgi:sorbitol-6-phosphate 2-dehydrogenase